MIGAVVATRGVFMSFELKNGQGKDEGQLSLFDYQLPKADFVPSNDDMDYKTWLMAQQKPAENKAGRFVTMSAALHIAAVLSLAFFSVPLTEEIKTETITIELPDDVPPVKFAAAPKGAPVVPSQGSQPVVEEKLPEVVKEDVKEVTTPEDIVMPAKAEAAPVAALPEKVQALPPKAKVAKAVKPVAAPKPATVAAVKSGSVAAKSNFAAVPVSVDDIEAPELDKGELAATPVDSNMTEDFNEDFAHVDNAQKQVLDNEQEKITALAAAVSQEQDENLIAADSANAEEAGKLALLQERVRQKNAAAIAEAAASDKAAALAKAQAREQAAREGAAREAAAKQAAAVAAAEAGKNGHGEGSEEGKGAGNNGNPAVAETKVAGEPAGVRSLDQLRQMPGNQRPKYDNAERLRGDQGAVVFYAYISKEGQPSQFRLVKSTGFRNLDGKTLVALKKWRFYPGQEGWVELPFRWDLKGGAQEDGGRLRAATN
jgi:TonB family protein